MLLTLCVPRVEGKGVVEMGRCSAEGGIAFCHHQTLESSAVIFGWVVIVLEACYPSLAKTPVWWPNDHPQGYVMT